MSELAYEGLPPDGGPVEGLPPDGGPVEPYADDGGLAAHPSPFLPSTEAELGQPGGPAVRQPAQPLVLIPLCRKGDRAGIERQLQAGASVEEVDCEGNTPLHVAVEAPKNEIATLQCLLEQGANVNASNYLGATPLHYVCLRKANQRGIANILLENGALIDHQTLAGKTSLHFACEQQVPELVEVLCLFGANVNICDMEGNTPLHSCLAKPGGRDTVKRQIAEHLINCGAVFQAPNSQGLMPLHLTCRGGYIRCLQLLLERQADPAALTSRGVTGLHLACSGGFPEVTQLVLQVAPHIMDRQDVDGNTALHMTAREGKLDSALLLLRMGANVNLKNRSGQTALDLSKTRGADLNSTHNPELMQMLQDATRNHNCQQS